MATGVYDSEIKSGIKKTANAIEAGHELLAVIATELRRIANALEMRNESDNVTYAKVDPVETPYVSEY